MDPFPIYRFRDPDSVMKTEWQCASNIAVVKYWGKKTGQIPANPSLSLTLKKAVSQTKIILTPSKNFSVEFYLDENRNLNFETRIVRYFKEALLPKFPFLWKAGLSIFSHNTFPHSSGIASSASGFGSIALGLMTFAKQLSEEEITEKEFYKQASYYARLGSGSASRSIYGGWVEWGMNSINPFSENEFAQRVPSFIHPEFRSIYDTILITHHQQKLTSSSKGHRLMNYHPFAEVRYRQAGYNFEVLISALKSGDWETFIKLTELEAMTLHAMMMTSSPFVLLMKPETVLLIEKLAQFRHENKVPFAFTLDAGPNLHILYPKSSKEILHQFLQIEVKDIIHSMIEDETGNGPLNLKY